MYQTHKLRDTLEIMAPATPEAAAWSGWGTALKPAYEPILLARKPLAGAGAQTYNSLNSMVPGTTGGAAYAPDALAALVGQMRASLGRYLDT